MSSEPQAEHRTASARGPVFIVGMPRSGTKLLRGLMNQSPRIRILDPETDFFPFLVRWVQTHGRARSDDDFMRLYAALASSRYFVHRKQPWTFSPRDWRRVCAAYDAGGLFEGFIRYETATPRDAEVLVGDKSPAYVRHVAMLLAHFPNARIIHLVRDVRDHCASIRKAWNKDVRRAAYLWGRDVALAHRVCLANPERCIELRYEAVLGATEVELRRLCDFLGIEFTDEMMRLHRPAEELGDATGKVEVIADNFGKYGERLTAREIQAIESLALPTMRMLGIVPRYAKTQREMSWPERQLRRTKDAFELVMHGRPRLGVTGALRSHLAHARQAD
jgi:hypothetical protein